MSAQVAARVKAWRKRQSLKNEQRYLAGDKPVPRNGQSQLAIRTALKFYLRRAAARAAGIALPPIKSKR